MSVPAIHPPVLADVLPRRIAVDAALVAGFTILNGLAAQIVIHTSLTPVPFTLQTFAVLITAATLGTVRGLISLGLYVALGVVGVPWFSAGSHGAGGVTFGYIIGFLLAGLVVGRIADHGDTRSVLRTVGMFALGSLLVYAVGVPWLKASAHLPWSTALYQGMVLFLIADAIKAVAAGGALPGLWRLVAKIRR